MLIRFFLILILLVPCFFINKFLQKIIQPRRSGVRFFVYMFSVFALVFLYTFLLVRIVVYLFPAPMK
jgi:hypothetical protein